MSARTAIARTGACLGIASLLWAWPQPSHAQEDVESASRASDYRGGSVRLGAFAVNNIRTRLYYGPEDSPLSRRTDLEKDLGLKDSLTAFRAALTYRVGRKHGFNAGFYKVSLDGTKNLARTIELGDTEFDIDLDVVSRYEEQIVKFAYNFIFHDEGKVTLSVAPGIHFTDIDFQIATQNSTIEETESASTTAPLPVLGGRLVYRITPKLSMIASADVFFLNGSGEKRLADGRLHPVRTPDVRTGGLWGWA